MKRIGFVILLSLGFNAVLHAQPFDVSAGAQTGRQPYGSYFDGDIDSVSIYNGNLMLDITLFELPGREIPTGLRLIYNSQKWQNFYPGSYGFGIYTGGWRIYHPRGSNVGASAQLIWGCDESSPNFGMFRLTAFWMDGIGTKKWYDGGDVGGDCVQDPTLNAYMYSADDGGSYVYVDGEGNAQVHLSDGSVVYSSWAFRTANGNQITGDTFTGPTGVDTLGRTVAFETNKLDPPLQYYKRYTITDSNGNPQVYQLNYVDDYAVYNPINQAWQYTLDDRLLSIDLPNGRSYTFEYGHIQGFLTKVTLPTGGWIRYQYDWGSQFDPNNDRVVVRYISTDGVTEQEAGVWERTDASAEWRVVDFKRPMQEYTRHGFYKGLERWKEWYDSSWNIEQRREQMWFFQDLPDRVVNPLPSEWTTTVYASGGVEHTTSWQYDFTWPISVTQIDQSDWTGGVNPISRQKFWYTTVDGVFRKPAAIEVWGVNPVNQAFELQGRTEFEYDQFALFSTPPEVPGKNAAPHSSRLNLTTVKKFTAPGQYVTETFKYDDLGNVREHTDPLSHTTQISYADNFSDQQNRNTFAYPTQVTNAVGHVALTEYDYRTGLVTKTIDARGLVTQRMYDGMGRPMTIARPNGLTTTYEYDDAAPSAAEFAEIYGGNIRRIDTSFDKFYKPTRVRRRDPSGDILVDTEYDLNGRVARTSLPYRDGETRVWTTVTSYDAFDRPKVVTNPDGSTLQSSYAGNRVTHTDEAGNQRRLTYNVLGQLVKVEEPYPTLETPLTTNYSYYVFGSLARVDIAGQVRTFTHDWLGRKFSETHPESGTTTYQVDNDGRVTQRQDARGISASYTYDAIDRLTAINYSDETPDVGYAYDQNSFTGFLTTVTDGAGATTFTYNAAGQVTSEVRTFNGVSSPFTTEYEYNVDGPLVRVRYPSGREIWYPRRTGANLISDEVAGIYHGFTSSYLVDQMLYNAAGQLKSRKLGSQAVVTYTNAFNNRFQLTGIDVTHNSTPLVDIDYGYGPANNNNGKIRSRTDNLHSEHSVNYVYDSLQRLKQVTASSWSITWGFDHWGNRTSQAPAGDATSRVGTQTFGYNNDNRNTLFTYDLAGNVTSDAPGRFFVYDAENRIRRAHGSAVQDTQYVYDASGRRVKKTNSSGTTFYIYGLTGLLSEFTTVDTGATQASATDDVVYHVPEQTGTGILLVKANGDIVEHNRVLPYGELWETPPSSDNENRFTTYLRDPETGNDYAMARYYANRYGRFMSPDPDHVGANVTFPQSWNAYAYGMSDPIFHTDPTGAISEPRLEYWSPLDISALRFELWWSSVLSFSMWLPGPTAWETEGPTSTPNNTPQTPQEAPKVAGTTAVRPKPAVGEPKPPGWTPDWEWRYPEGETTRRVNPRWFDPKGGEWRWHPPDKYHPQGHWDYNPWDEWNSRWRNVPADPNAPVPAPGPSNPWWQPLMNIFRGFNPNLIVPLVEPRPLLYELNRRNSGS